MNSRSTLLLPLVFCAATLSAPAPAQEVGTMLGEVVLEGYSQTKAESFDDFTGRTVLIEFFAYW